MVNKLLVTGADGFIGSHLVEKLVLSGFSVKAFCLYNSNGSWGWLDTLDNNIKNNLEVVLGDVRDFTCVRNAMNDCNIVFHLASLIAIPYSYVAPRSYVDTNIHGTLNVLEAARELDVDMVVHTSTSETYGTAKFVPITEDHPLVGQSPYAASKIGADQIALSYWRSFNIPVCVLRPFNTYGPRQSARAVIPAIITQIYSGAKQIKLGALSPTRDFNFVSDTCDAFIAVSKSQNVYGKVLNSASNFEISIGETVKLISSLMNKEIEVVTDEERLRPKNSEVNRLFGSNKLLKEMTDWTPKYGEIDGFKRGIKKTIEWFSDSKNLAYYKAGKYSI